MHVAVDTNCILPGKVGGIEHYTLGLLQRLAGDGSPADRVLVLTRPENHALFAPMGERPSVSVVCQPRAAENWVGSAAAIELVEFQQHKRRILHEHCVDVVHFPGNTINPIDLDLPVVLNLHDLQHLHYPQYFTADELTHREQWWTASARRADVLLAASTFVADDLHSKLGVDRNRIVLMPDPMQDEYLSPPSEAQVASVKAEFRLDRPFFLYPAAYWPHKNHARLFKAMADLADLQIQLVLTGGGLDCAELLGHLTSLNLHGSVRLLGRVDTLSLRCLYRLAVGMVMPSEHESISLPVLEAMASDCPVACSNVTSLPEQVGGAALLFSPHEADEIAASMRLLLAEPTLRKTLARRGRTRLAEFSADASVLALRTAYTQAVRKFAQPKAA